jgi:Protein of unknown function (DUF1049).
MRLFVRLLTVTVVVIGAVFLGSNAQIVTVRLVPDEIDIGVPKYDVPLYFLALVFTIFGLVIGVLSEYLRAHKGRKNARKTLRQIEILNNEVKFLRGKSKSETDEILGLIK